MRRKADYCRRATYEGRTLPAFRSKRLLGLTSRPEAEKSTPQGVRQRSKEHCRSGPDSAPEASSRPGRAQLKRPAPKRRRFREGKRSQSADRSSVLTIGGQLTCQARLLLCTGCAGEGVGAGGDSLLLRSPSQIGKGIGPRLARPKEERQCPFSAEESLVFEGEICRGGGGLYQRLLATLWWW